MLYMRYQKMQTSKSTESLFSAPEELHAGNRDSGRARKPKAETAA